MRIGFIGLGAMGLPMAGHLVAAGHDVTVASRGRREPLLEGLHLPTRHQRRQLA